MICILEPNFKKLSVKLSGKEYGFMGELNQILIKECKTM